MFDSSNASVTNWPVATEWSEDVWHTSEWVPQILVGRKLRRIVKEGRKLPSEEIVTNVIAELAKAIKENGGMSAQKQTNFEQILNRLDCGEQR